MEEPVPGNSVEEVWINSNPESSETNTPSNLWLKKSTGKSFIPRLVKLNASDLQINEDETKKKNETSESDGQGFRDTANGEDGDQLNSAWKSDEKLIKEETPPQLMLEIMPVKKINQKITQISRSDNMGSTPKLKINRRNGQHTQFKKQLSSSSLKFSEKSTDTGTTRKTVTKNRHPTGKDTTRILTKAESLEVQFSNKRQEYMKYKQELQVIQSTTMEIYKSLQDLQKKIAVLTKKEMPVESFDLIRFDIDLSLYQQATDSTKSFAIDLETILQRLNKISLEILTKRKEILTEIAKDAGPSDQDKIDEYAANVSKLEKIIGDLDDTKNFHQIREIIVQITPKTAADTMELMHKLDDLASKLANVENDRNNFQKTIAVLKRKERELLEELEQIKWENQLNLRFDQAQIQKSEIAISNENNQSARSINDNDCIVSEQVEERKRHGAGGRRTTLNFLCIAITNVVAVWILPILVDELYAVAK